MKQETANLIDKYHQEKLEAAQIEQEALEAENQKKIDQTLLFQQIKAEMILPAFNELVTYLNDKGYDTRIVDEHNYEIESDLNIEPVSLYTTPESFEEHKSIYMKISFSHDMQSIKLLGKQVRGKNKETDIPLNKVNIDLIHSEFVSFWTSDRALC